MKLIPLGGKHGFGKFAIVDDDDYERLVAHRWYVSDNGYVCRSAGPAKNRAKLRIHREILTDVGIVDHINRNRLDNRKENLRSVTSAQNVWNSIPTGKSAFKGVCFRNGGKVFAQILKRHIGYFPTEQEAALAYNRAAIEHFGEYAFLNVIDGHTDSHGFPLEI